MNKSNFSINVLSTAFFLVASLFFINQARAETSASGIVTAKPCYDFFGTGRTSFANFSTSSLSGARRFWRLQNNGGIGSETIQWGFDSVDDAPTPGYFDNDNRADIAIWRRSAPGAPAYFYVRPSTSANNPQAMNVVQWGLSEDQPNRSADYDGDGRDDFTVLRRNNGNWVWYILRSSDNSFRAITFGIGQFGSPTEDVPLPSADYTGDGRAEIVVLRRNPQGAETHFVGDAMTGALVLAQDWGEYLTDTFVAGDYIGDSRADFVVWRGRGNSGNGVWWIKENGGERILTVPFGIASNDNTDMAICGDYNGDGKSDIAVYRTRTSTYYWLNSPDFTTFSGHQFGEFGDRPVAGLKTF